MAGSAALVLPHPVLAPRQVPYVALGQQFAAESASLLARLQQNKRYPASAEARREQGVATLSFTVDRHGRVLARSITRSSGSAALDGEVLAMVQRAQPLPAFPPAMTQDSVNLVVPIRFSLR